MRNRRIGYGAAIVILLVIALSIVAFSAFAQTPFPPEPHENEPDEFEAVPAAEPAITIEDARSAAQAHLGTSAAPQEVELEISQGRLVYSVEFAGVEVEVDASTGDIVGTWSDDD